MNKPKAELLAVAQSAAGEMRTKKKQTFTLFTASGSLEYLLMQLERKKASVDLMRFKEEEQWVCSINGSEPIAAKTAFTAIVKSLRKCNDTITTRRKQYEAHKRAAAKRAKRIKKTKRKKTEKK